MYRLGALYNKHAIIEYLIAIRGGKSAPLSHLSHIRKLKDVVEIAFPVTCSVTRVKLSYAIFRQL